jgi:homocitrate synthase NifV
MLARLLPCIRIAVKSGFKVSVGLEDASRARPGFLVHVAQEAARAGATSVQIADTVGVLTPSSAESLVALARSEGGLPVSFHGHNDFGMALACACGAVRGGAYLVEGTLLGIGERAGNVDLRLFAELKGSHMIGIDLDALRDAECIVRTVAQTPWTKGIAGAVV